MTGVFGIVLALFFCAGTPGWRVDFEGDGWKKMPPNRDWRYDGGKLAIANTKFYVKDGALLV